MWCLNNILDNQNAYILSSTRCLCFKHSFWSKKQRSTIVLPYLFVSRSAKSRIVQVAFDTIFPPRLSAVCVLFSLHCWLLVLSCSSDTMLWSSVCSCIRTPFPQFLTCLFNSSRSWLALCGYMLGIFFPVTPMPCHCDSCLLYLQTPHTRNLPALITKFQFCPFTPVLRTSPLLTSRPVCEMRTESQFCPKLRTSPLLMSCPVCETRTESWFCPMLRTSPLLMSRTLGETRTESQFCPVLRSSPLLTSCPVCEIRKLT